MHGQSTRVRTLRLSRLYGAVLIAACVLGTSLTRAAEPPSLDDIKTQLEEQRSEIKSLYVQTKREFKSPFSAEELRTLWDLWGRLPTLEPREEHSSFKGQKRYYHYIESANDYTPPPAPELSDDATPLERVIHERMVERRRRFEEGVAPGGSPRTIVTGMDYATGFNGKTRWERTASEVMYPDGRTERQASNASSHDVRRTPWIPPGAYLYHVGWVVLGDGLATVSASQADAARINSLPALFERWPFSVSKVTEVVDGAECVVLTGTIERTIWVDDTKVKRNDKLWLDLDRGLALRKREWTSEAGRALFRQVTSDWHEVAPGFWLPKHVELQTVVPAEATRYAEKYRGRVVLSRHVTLVKCLVDNVPDDLFEVPSADAHNHPAVRNNERKLQDTARTPEGP